MLSVPLGSGILCGASYPSAEGCARFCTPFLRDSGLLLCGTNLEVPLVQVPLESAAVLGAPAAP